jgi:hypothetical protein
VVAQGYAADDKVSKSGDTMSGPLNFQGTPAYTVVRGTHAGTLTLNGTSAVSVSTDAVDSDSLILLTVQPGTAPVGIPYVASITAESGFTVKSTSASDTATTVAWAIVEAVAA